MAQITSQNNPVHTSGDLPAAGQTAPVFTPVAADLSDKTLADFASKRKVLNIFPSVDTGICAQSARAFNKCASSLDNVVVLCTSADLPFAQAHFRSAEDLDRVATLSFFYSSFVADYGAALIDSPLCGLTACAVLVLDENDKVLHSELVAEVINGSDYDAALAVL